MSSSKRKVVKTVGWDEVNRPAIIRYKIPAPPPPPKAPLLAVRRDSNNKRYLVAVESDKKSSSGSKHRRRSRSTERTERTSSRAPSGRSVYTGDPNEEDDGYFEEPTEYSGSDDEDHDTHTQASSVLPTRKRGDTRSVRSAYSNTLVDDTRSIASTARYGKNDATPSNVLVVQSKDLAVRSREHGKTSSHSGRPRGNDDTLSTASRIRPGKYIQAPPPKKQPLNTIREGAVDWAKSKAPPTQGGCDNESDDGTCSDASSATATTRKAERIRRWTGDLPEPQDKSNASRGSSSRKHRKPSHRDRVEDSSRRSTGGRSHRSESKR